MISCYSKGGTRIFNNCISEDGSTRVTDLIEPLWKCVHFTFRGQTYLELVWKTFDMVEGLGFPPILPRLSVVPGQVNHVLAHWM